MFKGTLFESQKPGAQFLCAKKTGILAWEQGTGKTVIAIASAERLFQLGLVSSTLVFAPSSIAWQWEDKLGEFSNATTQLVHAKSKFRGNYDTTASYTITNYNLLLRDYEAIAKRRYDVIICDEAQAFKNNQSKTAKALKALNVAIRPKYKWALTGTVISNKLEELYSIMYWVDPRFFGDWKVFEKRHIVRNQNTKQIMRYKGLQTINAGLPGRLNRKTQEEVGDMPKLLFDTQYVEKEKELRDAERVLLDRLNQLAEFCIDAGGDFTGVVAAEVASAFSEVKKLLATRRKLQLAVELTSKLLEENIRNRVVIFSFYKDPLYSLRDTFNDHAIQAYTFTGNEIPETKRRNISAFKDQKSVLLCSNAGKAGLDLPFANYVIHVDVPFSYEVLDQRNKRITRATSPWTSVKSIYLVVKKSIEEYYLKQTGKKEALSNAVYTGNADAVTMKTKSLRQFLDESIN